VTGVSAEPGEKATDVSVWGWDRHGDGSWMAITFDFKKIMGSMCESGLNQNNLFAPEQKSHVTSDNKNVFLARFHPDLKY